KRSGASRSSRSFRSTAGRNVSERTPSSATAANCTSRWKEQSTCSRNVGACRASSPGSSNSWRGSPPSSPTSSSSRGRPPRWSPRSARRSGRGTTSGRCWRTSSSRWAAPKRSGVRLREPGRAAGRPAPHHAGRDPAHHPGVGGGRARIPGQGRRPVRRGDRRGAGGTGAITGLAQKIVLTPVGGDVDVSWHRSAIHVRPDEGWKPDRVYHLEVLPGIADLRRNVTKTGATIVFSTGGPIPTAALSGTALLWVEQRLLTQAVIRAAPLPDTAAYVTLTDSAGNFRLLGIPPGRYRVWAIQDQNNNRRQDRREPFDTVSVTVDSTANAVLWAFVHDTIGPRVRTIEPVDSFTLRINFSSPLDPARPPDTAAVRVFGLPDTTPVGVRALYRPAQ